MATQVTLNSGSVDSAGSLALKTNGTTTAVTIDTSQNVGIGTASPASDARLTLASPTTESYVMFSRTNSGVFDAAVGNNAGSLVFKGGADSATVAGLTEFMRIDSSGNVGIGTSSPGSSLHVSKTTTTLSGTGNGYGVHVYPTSSGDTYVDAITGSSGNTTLTFRTYNNGTYNNVRIDSSGNLLVGATAAISDERLYVRATTTTGFAFRLYNTQATAGSTFGQYILYSGSSPNGTGNQFLRCDDSTTTRAEIRSNGGLANYSANNYNFASDLRLKHDIEPVQSYWNVFKSIEWKTWLYNDQTDDIKNIGVIAQELQVLAPELVCESNAMPTPEGESPYLGLWENDFKMAGMSVITELVKRCDEQQAIITSLTDRITALEAK